MRAAVFQRVDLPVDALEGDPLAQDVLALDLALPELVAEQGGIPVVAKATRRAEVRLPGLPAHQVVDGLVQVALAGRQRGADRFLNRFLGHAPSPPVTSPASGGKSRRWLP